MELILREDVQNLGFKDDLVTVKNGYGRNYLIPNGLAVLATPSAKKVLAENLRQKAHKEKELIEETASGPVRLGLETALFTALRSGPRSSFEGGHRSRRRRAAARYHAVSRARTGARTATRSLRGVTPLPGF